MILIFSVVLKLRFSLSLSRWVIHSFLPLLIIALFVAATILSQDSTRFIQELNENRQLVTTQGNSSIYHVCAHFDTAARPIRECSCPFWHHFKKPIDLFILDIETWYQSQIFIKPKKMAILWQWCRRFLLSPEHWLGYYYLFFLIHGS